ncbi:MAG: hypothetical protein RL319_408 [Actinomycetota bacterium]
MKSKSVKRMLGSILLAFEAFIVFFATLVAFGLKAADGPTVWAVGLTLSFLCILTPGILGRKYSYYWGWALQIALIALGFWVVAMFYIGVLCACLWAWAMIAGGTIDRAKAAYEATGLGQTGIDEN